MDQDLFDQFTLVMIIMTLKEIAHSEIYRTNPERTKRWMEIYPTLMASVYVCSWGVTLWFTVSNPLAALAGFLAGFLWEVLMPPLENSKK